MSTSFHVTSDIAVNGDTAMHLMHEELARERMREQAAMAEEAGRRLRVLAHVRRQRRAQRVSRRVRAVLSLVR